MSGEFYKVMHITGVLMVFLGLGGLIVRSLITDEAKHLKKLSGLTHGIGLVLALVGGFGMLAKFKFGFDGWVWIKIVIWLALGGLVAVINRKLVSGKVLWWIIILLGALAAYLARFKPF